MSVAEFDIKNIEWWLGAIAVGIIGLLKKYIKLSCLLLALLLLIFILTIHIPQLFEPSKAQFAFMELLKDTALMGGALLIASIYKEEKTQDI